MAQAFDSDKNSTVAKDIENRMKEIKIEFKLDPDLMENGRRISSKRYALSLQQKIKFDTNVTLANDQSTVTQSKKESYIFDSEFYAKGDFVFKKRFITSIDFKILNTKYSDTKNSSVYQNNSYSFYSNLKNKFEHTLFQKPASFLFDWTTHMLQEINSKRKNDENMPLPKHLRWEKNSDFFPVETAL